MVSKELMSEVLGKDILLVDPVITDSIITYRVGEKDDENYEDINMYEFMHLCKEWMLKVGFGVQITTLPKEKSTKVMVAELEIKFHPKIYGANEYESAIKACEYILKETSNG